MVYARDDITKMSRRYKEMLSEHAQKTRLCAHGATRGAAPTRTCVSAARDNSALDAMFDMRSAPAPFSRAIEFARAFERHLVPAHAIVTRMKECLQRPSGGRMSLPLLYEFERFNAIAVQTLLRCWRHKSLASHTPRRE